MGDLPRGSQFTDQFDAVFDSCGLRIVKGSPQALAAAWPAQWSLR
jgi:hypothetical protein